MTVLYFIAIQKKKTIGKTIQQSEKLEVLKSIRHTYFFACRKYKIDGQLLPALQATLSADGYHLKRNEVLSFLINICYEIMPEFHNTPAKFINRLLINSQESRSWYYGYYTFGNYDEAIKTRHFDKKDVYEFYEYDTAICYVLLDYIDSIMGVKERMDMKFDLERKLFPLSEKLENEEIKEL